MLQYLLLPPPWFLSRTLSSWVFCNPREVLGDTGYRRGPLQLSSVD